MRNHNLVTDICTDPVDVADGDVEPHIVQGAAHHLLERLLNESMLLMESLGCTSSMALTTSSFFFFFFTSVFSSLALILLLEMSEVRTSPGCQVA